MNQKFFFKELNLQQQQQNNQQQISGNVMIQQSSQPQHMIVNNVQQMAQGSQQFNKQVLKKLK